MQHLLSSLLVLLIFFSGCTKTETKYVEVSPTKALTSVHITSQNGSSIDVGDQSKMSLIAVYNDGNVTDVSSDGQWASSNTAVATIDTAGVVTAHTDGNTTITGSFADKNATFTLVVGSPVLTSVHIFSGKGSEFLINTSVVLSAIGVYSDGSVENVTDATTWNSSNTTVATISATGEVSTFETGSTEITALFDNISKVSTLTVINPSIISIQLSSQTGVHIKKETSAQFNAIAILNNGDSVDITEFATWTSSDNSIATVGNSSPHQGVVNGVKVGQASISSSYGGATSSIDINVSAPELTFITLSKDKTDVAAGYSVQMKATGYYKDDSSQDITNDVTWSSSDTSIATINIQGEVKTLKDGNVTISAVMSGIKSQLSLEVLPATLVTTEIKSNTTEIPVGLSTNLVCIGTFSDGRIEDVTSDTEFISLDPSKADVIINLDNTVSLLAKDIGSVDIEAHVSNQTTTKTYTITSAVLQSIAITAPRYEVQQDSTLQLTATASLSDGTTQDITQEAIWISEDISIATVTNSGLVTGNTLGSTLITASLDNKDTDVTIQTVEAILETHVSTTAELRTALTNAATNGMHDKIILADGTYKTTDDGLGTFIYLSNDENRLILQGSKSNNVILSGDNVEQVLNHKSTEDAPLKLEKLSFVDGNNTPGDGGGVYTDYSIEVIDCNFTNNSVSESGGGFYARNHSKVVNSTFTNNSIGTGGGGGAGFYSSDTIVTNSTFTNNSVGYGGGGGFFSRYATVNNSIFSNNDARGGGGGFFTSYATVNDSIFTNNNVNYRGGGFYTSHSLIATGLLLIENSTGMYLSSGVNHIILNSIFLDNNTSDIDGGENSIISNLENNYIDTSKVTVSYFGKNNIFTGVNLGFVDKANNDYHLTSSSDLIDLGLTTFPDVEIPAEDFDGVSRPQGSAIDIGPYEYQP